ncbi:MAG: hypothetical protein K0R77_1738 [Chryseobacterium sp.]|jgi:hypothetical protein|uniref:hypothetical protein n=1 Tax=Chryseobacterium sp. TaxID=1871047 RepID=UPI0026187134|nr:hypothetical protein [Chryseobacterium sp.]MDF2552463.1 hypothetical protein [Chryseobacterium sp.]
MIQVSDILGKDYDDIKDLIIRTDFDEETLKSFSDAGINPPLTDAKLKKEIYFFEFKIERNKISFFENKVFEILFACDRQKTADIIQDLLNQNIFEFKFYTNKQIENTEWLNKDDDSEEGFLEWKFKRLEFDNSLVFDVNNLDMYSRITFHSEKLSIIIKNQIIDDEAVYLFELNQNLNKSF